MTTPTLDIVNTARRTPWVTAWLTLSFGLFFAGPLLSGSYGDLVHLSKLVFFLPALIYLGRRQVAGHRPFRPDAGVVLLLAFLALGAVSLAWAPEPRITRVFHGIAQILVTVVAIREVARHHRSSLLAAVSLAALATAVVAALIVALFYSVHPLAKPLYEDLLGLRPWLPDANQLIATMTIMPSAFVLLAATTVERAPRQRLLFLIGAVACVAFLLLLQRRTGLVALMGGLGALLVLGRNKRLLIALAVVAACGLILIVTDVGGYVSRGDTHRLELWGIYLELAGQKPWFGHGLTDDIPTVTTERYPALPYDILHPHNILISLYYCLGVVGLALFVGFGLRLATRITRRATLAERTNLVLLAPLVPGLITLMFDGEKVVTPFWPNWNCLWLPVALAVAATVTPTTRTATS